MPNPDFTDSSVSSYVNDITDEALSTLIDDLSSDFDSAVSSRFNVSSSQDSTLSNTPDFFKQAMISAFQNYKMIRDNGATVTFSMSGLNPDGQGGGLQDSKIRIYIRHYSDCTWEIGIEIEK
jgi:hypothetical protein